MHKYVGFILVALCAGASGCSSKAEAQMPTAPARTITADTDVNQLMAGTVSAPSIGSAGVPVQVYFRLLDGPFVLTDMFAATGSQPILYALPAGQDCALAGMAAI